VADSSEAADTLVDLMQMFRDKKNIFGRASELLCRLISASAKIKVSVDFIVSLCLPFFQSASITVQLFNVFFFLQFLTHSGYL
jgi:hypothetical protein